MGTGGWVKWPGREADKSPPPRTGDRNVSCYKPMKMAKKKFSLRHDLAPTNHTVADNCVSKLCAILSPIVPFSL